MGLFYTKPSEMSQEELERLAEKQQREENAEGLGWLLALVVMAIVIFALLFSGENVQPGGRFYRE